MAPISTPAAGEQSGSGDTDVVLVALDVADRAATRGFLSGWMPGSSVQGRAFALK